MYQRIRSGSVLPILGGAVRLKRIFGLEHTEAQPADPAASPVAGTAAGAGKSPFSNPSRRS